MNVPGERTGERERARENGRERAQWLLFRGEQLSDNLSRSGLLDVRAGGRLLYAPRESIRRRIVAAFSLGPRIIGNEIGS